jgi:hypothetical protein
VEGLNISASVNLGEFGATALFFWGGPIIGIDIGPSFGPNIDFTPHGVSYMWVYQFHHWWDADPARWAWDFIETNPLFGPYLSFTPLLLSLAKWGIQHRRR